MLTPGQKAQREQDLRSGAVAPNYIVLDDNIAGLSARILDFIGRHYAPLPQTHGAVWQRKPVEPTEPENSTSNP